MANKTVSDVTIQLRRDTSSNWATENPVLAAGELGYETDTRKGKVGDGTTAWNSLNYAFGGGTDVYMAHDSNGNLNVHYGRSI